MNKIKSNHLSWTKTATSQVAKKVFLDKKVLTSSSGISLNTRVFLFPYSPSHNINSWIHLGPRYQKSYRQSCLFISFVCHISIYFHPGIYQTCSLLTKTISMRVRIFFIFDGTHPNLVNNIHCETLTSCCSVTL